jgi:hypothetical protein
VTTHQVEEIQHILTDGMFINRGRIVLDCSMEEFESRYLGDAHRACCAAGRSSRSTSASLRLRILLFDHVDRDQLAALGEVRTLGIADLFVAVMGNQANEAQEPRHEYSIDRRARISGRLAALPAAMPAMSRPGRCTGRSDASCGEPVDLYRRWPSPRSCSLDLIATIGRAMSTPDLAQRAATTSETASLRL